MGATPVIRVNNVDVVRDGNPILRDVSLTVRPGEHWALLGVCALRSASVTWC